MQCKQMALTHWCVTCSWSLAPFLQRHKLLSLSLQVTCSSAAVTAATNFALVACSPVEAMVTCTGVPSSQLARPYSMPPYSSCWGAQCVP